MVASDDNVFCFRNRVFLKIREQDCKCAQGKGDSIYKCISRVTEFVEKYEYPQTKAQAHTHTSQHITPQL